MIVFSALVPHAPFLVPSVGKAASEQLTVTRLALEQVEERLVLARPDTIVVISPHAPHYADAWSANMSPTFSAHMQDFGDHETTVPARVNYLLIDRVHRALREASIPFTLRSSELLDYGYTVPLLALTKHLTNWSLVPLAPSEHSLEEQARFGAELYKILQAEDARIAIIASADLCHHGSAEAAASPTQATHLYDQAVRQAVQLNSLAHLITASQALPAEKHPCGERPIAILLGSLQESQIKPEEHAYEAPLGVGYLTASFRVA